jgi:AcrR family transcriptional regulator
MPMSTAEAVDGDKPNGPRSRKGVQTRARLVDAAKQIFEENGFLEARISDIAERAGLSHGSFYHYFDSKEQVFREVAEEVLNRLAAPMTEVVLVHGSSTPPAERLREAIHRHLEMYQEDARIMGVIEQVSRYDDYVRDVIETQNRTSRELIADSIEQLQKRGMADRELEPLVASAALGSMTSRFAELWLAQGMVDFDLDAASATVTRLFVNALGIDQDVKRPKRS